MAKPAKKKKADSPVVTQPQTEPHRSVPTFAQRQLWMGAFMLLMGCLLIYMQTANYQFINYDDPNYVTGNRMVTGGLTAEGFKWAFTSVNFYYWHPLTWLSLMTDCQLFGVKPGPMHIVNMVFHAANAALLLWALHALTGALWRSIFAAALFALHPLRVESVAWISERKDVLSGLFWILTLIAYARYAKSPSRQRYILVLAAFLAAVMSKPTVVTLPFVLLLLDWWPLARWRSLSDLGAMAKEKVPMFVVIALVSVLTFVGQSATGATVELSALPVWYRVWNALLGYVRYLGKFFWPSDLGVLYPLGKMNGGEVFLAFVLLTVITALALIQARKRGYFTTGWLWFLGAMVPMIGLAQSGLQSFADRFTYLPMIGLSITVAWGASELCDRMRVPVLARAGMGAMLLGVLAFASMVQTSYWKDSFTLFDHTIAVTKDNDVMHLNLAGMYDMRGEFDKSIEHFEAALRIEPGNAEAHRLVGIVYWKKRDVPSAMRHFETTLKLRPDHTEARKALADCLIAMGRSAEAKQHLEMVLKFNPGDVEARARLMMMNRQ